MSSPEQLLHRQFQVMMALPEFPSGSRYSILTPSQLTRLDVLTRDSSNPVDQGLRAVFRLDDLEELDGQGRFVRPWEDGAAGQGDA